MPTAQINDIEIYYQDQGSGTPLLCIAGLGSDSSNWQPVANKLAKSLRVITMDNRGCGRTTPMEAETSIEQMADDCMALARHLEIGRINLLGHSMGGMVAMACALRHPDAVDQLILSGTAPRTTLRNQAMFNDWTELLASGMDPYMWLHNVYYWVFCPRFFNNPAAVDTALRAALDAPHPQSTTAFARQVSALNGFDVSDALPTIRTQTLIISGEEDILITPEASRELLAIPESEFVTIPKAAHSIYWENPRAYLEHVLAFLSRG